MKQIKNKHGEGYIDTCISVFVIICILAVVINIFGFIKLKVELDQIADELITAATYSGCFDEEFTECDNTMLNDYFYYDIEFGADEYYNTSLYRVQLGDRMWVRVSVDTYVQGMGVFKIPMTVSVKRSGISEHYWKSDL